MERERERGIVLYFFSRSLFFSMCVLDSLEMMLQVHLNKEDSLAPLSFAFALRWRLTQHVCVCVCVCVCVVKKSFGINTVSSPMVWY